MPTAIQRPDYQLSDNLRARSGAVFLTACALLEARSDAAADPAPLRERVRELELAAARSHDGELAGMLMALLPRALAQAERRPAEAVSPAVAAARRREWCLVVAELADAARLRLRTDSPQAPWLAFIAHAATTLAGERPRALPAAAPPWLSARWLLIAGSDPALARRTSGTDDPPPLAELEARVLPASQRDGLAPLAQRLLAMAGDQPLEAVSLRCRVDEVLAGGDRLERLAGLAGLLSDAARTDAQVPEQGRIAAAIRAAPERERMLTRLLIAAQAASLAAADGARRLEALRIAEVMAREVGDRAWRGDEQDAPLAVALLRLVRHRVARVDEARAEALPNPVPGAAVTQRSEPLLVVVRDPAAPPRDAAAQAMLVDAQWMAIDRALVTALAAQEVAGLAVDWSLLRPWLGRSLALDLAVPVATESVSGGVNVP